ncbi:hypothetical protein ACWGKQ_21570 [Streptomyces sp. NPDC054770]
MTDGQLVGLDTDALGIEETLAEVLGRVDELLLGSTVERSLAL